MLLYHCMLLLQRSQNKMHRLCITFPAILFLTLNAFDVILTVHRR